MVTLIRGRHVLHFGGEFLINRADSTAWGNTNAGTMNYTGRLYGSHCGRHDDRNVIRRLPAWVYEPMECEGHA